MLKWKFENGSVNGLRLKKNANSKVFIVVIMAKLKSIYVATFFDITLLYDYKISYIVVAFIKCFFHRSSLYRNFTVHICTIGAVWKIQSIESIDANLYKV